MLRLRNLALLALLLLVVGLAWSTGPASATESKIEVVLLQEVQEKGTGTYWVYMTEQANLDAAYSIDDWSERGRYVYDALRLTADRSQEEIRALLDAGVKDGTVASYRSYFIVNALQVTSTADVMIGLAARSDVAQIAAPKSFAVPPFRSVPAPQEINALEWGIAMINADDVWNTFGLRGEGIVVANIDTGVDYDHPALDDQYRGNLGGSYDHDFNWYDPSAVCSPTEPCDNHGHGTHTMGTMVGDDTDDGGTHQIGVAPGATWIAAKGCELSTCSDGALTSSAEWILAPCALGDDPGSPSCDPDMRPHIVNNSWGGGGGDPWYQSYVDAWRAAGIFPSFSAGNSGPGSGTIGSPGDYCNVVAVGATTSSDTIADFSSRGPGDFPDCTDKPDISAPGSGVISSVPGGGYASNSGTSMASPHLAGCSALLLSIDPTLDYDRLYQVLTENAVDLGAPGFDYDYGNGRLDCYAAALQLQPDFTLSATPATQNICVPEDALYDVTVGQIQDFTDPVTLSALGNPAGTTADFDINPVIPPGASQLTIGNTAGAAAGDYGIDIVGVAPTSTHTTTVQLSVFDAAAGATTLLSPADGATGVDLVPTLSWQPVVGAAEYRVQVWEIPGMTLVYDETTTETDHTLMTALSPLTEYQWQVDAQNPCGGTSSALFSFTTRDIPPILLVDDDDNGPDVRATYTGALDALGLLYDVWDTGNSDNEPDATYLAPYEVVIWFTGDEFGGAAGPGGSGEAALGTWLDTGKCLLISSQDYHWDRGLTSFMQTYLGVSSVTNDVSQTTVTGQGVVFGGLGPYTLSYPFTNFSDVVAPDATAELAFSGNVGDAAADKDDGVYRTSFWGFPFEAIALEANRLDAMGAFVNWCGAGVATGTLEGYVYSGNTGIGMGGATVTAQASGGNPRSTTTAADGYYAMTLAVNTYDVAANLENYAPETITGAAIITDTVTQVDFTLYGSELTFSPGAIEETMDIGDVVTSTVTVTNTGPLSVDWSATIGNFGGPLGPIPASDGNFARGSAAPSLGRAPFVTGGAGSGVMSGILAPDSPAFGVDLLSATLWTFTLDAATSPTPVNSLFTAAYAGDFVAGAFDTLYVVDDDTATLYAVDTATGVPIVVGPMVPVSGQTWTGMSYDPTSGTMYALSTDCSNNTLYSVNLATGALTTEATFSGVCVIDIGVSPGGQMYGIDIIGDLLGSIDKSTGAWSAIGSIGFDANFAQGADFDDETGTFYLAAYNNALGAAQLRIADLTTGNTALVSNIGPGAGAEVDAFGIAAGGGGAADWVVAVPDSGTIPADSVATFDVVFDARSLFEVGDYTAELSFTGTFVNQPPAMPLTMHLGCPTCGFLNGSITDWLTTDPLTAQIYVTGPGGFEVTLNADSYDLAVQPGTYEFEVSANGYLTEVASVPVAQGQTVTTDFALVPAIAMLEYTPADIEEFMEVGDVVTNTVTVENTGYTTLTFDVDISNFAGPVVLSIENMTVTPLANEAPAGAVDPTALAAAGTVSSILSAPPALLADVNLVLDDGTRENALGLTSGGQFIWLNRFTPDPGDFPFTLNEVQVLFGSGVGVNVGELVDIYVWEDTDGDGDPGTGEVFLGSETGVQVQAVDDVTWSVYSLSPAIELNGPGDVVIAVVNRTAGTDVGEFPAAMDETSSAGRSWVGIYSSGNPGDPPTLPADSAWGVVDGFGFPGNFMLRGFGSFGSAVPPWAFAVPDAGAVPPASTATFDVVFDATGLTQLGDYTAELTFSGNFVNEPPAMPLTMHLSCPTCGTLAGSITDAFTTDPLTADIHITSDGGFDLLLTGDSYNVTVPAGSYDINVSAADYFSETATVDAVTGSTVTTDFALVPQIAVLEYSPPAIEGTVFLGDSTWLPMTIGNAGTVPFDFELQDAETGRPTVMVEPTVVCPADAFGYTCIDSNEAGGPTFDWIDISATGTDMGLSDDSYFYPISLPFSFNFYGTDHSQVAVGSNGTVYFEDAYLGFSNTAIPASNSYGVADFIAVYWDDLNPASAGAVYYEIVGEAPLRKLIVQWEGVPNYGTSDAVTAQAILFEGTNNILVQYLDPSGEAGSGATTGIQGDTATGLQYGFNTAHLSADLAICYVYPGSTDPTCLGATDARWAFEDPDTGTVDAGASQEVMVHFEADDPTVVTQTGAYEGLLYFNGTFDNDVLPADLTMNVIEPGTTAIVLTTTVSTDGSCGTTDTMMVPAGTEVTYCYTVTNIGDNTLSGHVISDSEMGEMMAFDYALHPGMTESVLMTMTITETMDSESSWLAFTTNTDATGTDNTLVEVMEADIALTQTVSTDGSCGTDQAVTVKSGEDVTFCYTVVNTGDVTLTLHSLVDDISGTLLTDEPHELTPGASFEYLVTVTIEEAPPYPVQLQNCGTWTATDGVYTGDAQSCTDITVTTPEYHLHLPVIMRP